MSCSPRVDPALAKAAAARAARAAAERSAVEAAEARAREIVSRMDDAALAAQVLLTGIDGSAALSPRSAELLARVSAGGVMLFKYNLGRGRDAARRLAADIRAAVPGEVPPLIAVDHEGGSVHRFGDDVLRLPAAAAFGALDASRCARVAEEAAYLSGRELRALGVTLNLAPVAETADDQSSAFLGDRAYGKNPETVAAAASAFVEGMRRAGISCAVKHFPGNAAADPHASRAVVSARGEALDELLKSFSLTFGASYPAAVMVSHAVVEAVDPARPATLSSKVIEGLLRGQLGFRGLAVSDDLRMKAIADAGYGPERAAVEAVKAGIDLVMTWPADAERLRDALAAAAASGELPRERLEEAAVRVVALKLRGGVFDAAPEPEAEPGALKAETERFLRAEGLR